MMVWATPVLVLSNTGLVIINPVAASTNVHFATWPRTDLGISSKSRCIRSPISNAIGSNCCMVSVCLGLKAFILLQMTQLFMYRSIGDYIPI